MTDSDQGAKPARVKGAIGAFELTGEADTSREATLSRLRSLEIDEAPDGLPTDFPQGGLRSVDDEPALLVYDSSIDAELLVSVRAGAPTVRQLTFEGRGLALELEVSASGHLIGQVVPAQGALVELRHRKGSTSIKTDGLGCFQLEKMPDGPVSFRCSPTGGSNQAVATSWISL